MNKKQVQICIDEFFGVHEQEGDDETSLLEAALFVEDVFHFTLTDDEICGENLRHRQAMERFVLEKLKLA